MNWTTLLANVAKLKVIPPGTLTLFTGWLAVIVALLCAAGHPLPGIPCPQDAGQVATTGLLGLLGIGLGRRPQ